MTITKQQLIKAFTKWERECRRNPKSFWSRAKERKSTAPTVAKACAEAILNYLAKP